MSVFHITLIMRTSERVNIALFDVTNLSIPTHGMYDHDMTNTPAMPAIPKEAPDTVSVTQLRSMTSAILDDARVGHVTYIERGGREVAGMVPAWAAHAYQAGADARRAARDEIAEHVWTAISAITEALDTLLGEVDPAAKQAAVESMMQRVKGIASRHRAENDTTDDAETDAEDDEAAGADDTK